MPLILAVRICLDHLALVGRLTRNLLPDSKNDPKASILAVPRYMSEVCDTDITAYSQARNKGP